MLQLVDPSEVQILCCHFISDHHLINPAIVTVCLFIGQLYIFTCCRRFGYHQEHALRGTVNSAGKFLYVSVKAYLCVPAVTAYRKYLGIWSLLAIARICAVAQCDM